MPKSIKSVVGAIALAFTASVAVTAIAPTVAIAQTSQASALAGAITAAARSVTGTDAAAAAARQAAVQSAIDAFITQNGVDPSVAASLINQALALVAPSCS